METDGSPQRRLMPGGDHFDGSPSWSPDGNEIAFARRGVGLMVVPAVGGEPEPLYRSKVEISDVDWAPAGDRLAFTRGDDIYLFDRSSGDAEVLVRDAVHDSGLSWSPDGDTLAYTAEFSVYTSTEEEPNPRLFARDATTPAWSPDGNFLAYYTDAEDDLKIVIQPRDGGDVIRLDVNKKNIYSFEQTIEWLNCSP